mgnify:CR=1 FL=1
MTKPIPEIKIKEDLDARVVALKVFMDKKLSSKIFNVVIEEIE